MNQSKLIVIAAADAQHVQASCIWFCINYWLAKSGASFFKPIVYHSNAKSITFRPYSKTALNISK